MKNSFASLAKEFIKVIIIMAIAVPVISLLAATWTGPMASPPNNNADAPINVGNTEQVKIGGASFGSLISRGALLLSPFSRIFQTQPSMR